MSNESLVIITSHYFMAGVVTRRDRVVRFAPILSYMAGWKSSQVLEYAVKKRWGIEVMAGVAERHTHRS